MATTHVFIVDEKTFPIHLQYMFAGTGSKSYNVPIDPSVSLMNKNFTSMVADVMRIREGDKILFYVQQGESDSGRFYGIFKATSRFIFDDYSVPHPPNLNRMLPFRVKICPDEVYEKGIPEWDVLDDYEKVTSTGKIFELQWSLIYRKLKGVRGCTMITNYESERLCNLLRRDNRHLTGHSFNFDPVHRQITLSESTSHINNHNIPVDILSAMNSIKENGHRFEVQLQAYILQHIGDGKNESLDNCIFPHGTPLFWLGNEVSCGLGMRRIDILIISKICNDIHIYPIELKTTKADASYLNQIHNYLKWIKLYVTPNLSTSSIFIEPILITLGESRKRRKFREFKQELLRCSFNEFNENRLTVSQTKHIQFSISQDNITFK